MRAIGSSRLMSGLGAICVASIAGLGAGRPNLTECPQDGSPVSYRWNKEGDTLLVEGGGCITLPDVYRDLEDDSPLIPTDEDGSEVDEETGIWLLTKNLFMESGTALLIHGDLGCKELRLQSSSSFPRYLRGNGAYISLLDTKVFSWKRTQGTYDMGSSDGDQPRAYISIISEMTHDADTCEGAANDDAGEGRMDIINSEVAYLGYQASESYGLSYKVRGYCLDHSNPEIFERVNVRGDIRFSDIHHNWFGLYTFGHQDGNWEFNLMHDNGYYGFDPHDDSDNLRIHNNVVYNNGGHGIIASKRCNDVSIQNNVVYNTKKHGIMLHRSSDMSIIRNNTISESGEGCVAIFESFYTEVSGNVCDGSTQGIRLSMGSSHNKVFDNIIKNTDGRAIYFFKGSDPVEASDYVDGYCTDNLVENNYVEKAEEGAVVIVEARDNRLIGNTIVDAERGWMNDADGTLWKDNTLPDDFEFEIESTCFDPDSDLLQIAQAGGDIDTC